MRIWSIHPKYLDTKGLVALWREALLARNVLENKTIGYKNHPQLIRFIHTKYPLDSLNFYLSVVYNEAWERGLEFDHTKLHDFTTNCKISVTLGQLDYELSHLRAKLVIRDEERYRNLSKVSIPERHPLFIMVPGEVESWEKIKVIKV